MVSETSSTEVYEQIFAGIRDSRDLAQAIVRDGEGATKFITIVVEGGATRKECYEVGKAIANSPLVKTAFFASDPNLGRILAAVGNAGIADLERQAEERREHRHHAEQEPQRDVAAYAGGVAVLIDVFDADRQELAGHHDRAVFNDGSYVACRNFRKKFAMPICCPARAIIRFR